MKANPHIVLELTPPGLLDEPVTIRLFGLRPGESVTLRTAAVDHEGRAWSAWATMAADNKGRVDPSTHPAIAGTYEGIEAAGLFWSMTPDASNQEMSPFAIKSSCPIAVRVAAEREHGEAVVAATERLLLAPGVRRIPVRENGLIGTFFAPPKNGVTPGVIVLGGSGGGLAESMAALLSSRGLSALALAYFAIGELPGELCEIPLEYFEQAIHWMRQQEGVRDDALAVVGKSRGGELALLLGATFPMIRAVVGYVASGVVWRGLKRNRFHEPCAAWTYKGRPLPFLAGDNARAPAETSRQRGSTTNGFTQALRDTQASEEATIPVERTQGPILLFSASDDRIWPSVRLANIAMERLAKHDFPYPFCHRPYKGAGHLISLPNLPTTIHSEIHPLLGFKCAYGGTAKADAAAARNSWCHLLRFLKESLS